jgi:hypothetical protein
MKGEKSRVRAGFETRLFSFPPKNLRAMPAATIVADQNLAVEMSRRCGYEDQFRLSCTLRWIFESQMRAEGYLLPWNYLLGFVLLCICCQNKQSCWRIKAKSAVQHRGLKTLGFERETCKGGGKKADSSRRVCKELPVSTHKNTNTQIFTRGLPCLFGVS